MFTGRAYGGWPRHVLAADQDAAGGRQREAADHAQAGGLARARRPEQGEELAGLDRRGRRRRPRAPPLPADRRRRTSSSVTAAVTALVVARTIRLRRCPSRSPAAQDRDVVGRPTCGTARTGCSASCTARSASSRTRSSRRSRRPWRSQPSSPSSLLPLQASSTTGTEPNQADRSPCSFGFSECSSHM